MAQWIRGDLRQRYGKLCYSKEPVEKWDYMDQPHEIEARKEETRLLEVYEGRRGMPVETGHHLGQRLRSVYNYKVIKGGHHDHKGTRNCQEIQEMISICCDLWDCSDFEEPPVWYCC
ncbi:MAG: hypothetical protein CM15mV26_1040 [uncultured marine virus]|nr:MAG: hypothetical protein CM15mV26_1040 [uncultured marine virus]